MPIMDEQERKQQVMNIDREVEALIEETKAIDKEMEAEERERIFEEGKKNAKEMNHSSLS